MKPDATTARFLRFLDTDMKANPDRLQPMPAALMREAEDLVGPLDDVSDDTLDAPLVPADDD